MTPSERKLHLLLNDSLEEKDKSKKGWKFEVFFENLMIREPNFEFRFKHPRSRTGEIDYVYAHNLQDQYFWRISPYICIECKNWKDNITSVEINHFADLIEEKAPLSCCGVYLTTSSYEPSAKEAIKNCRIRNRILIIPVERKHLADLIKVGFEDFIRKLCEEKVFKK